MARTYSEPVEPGTIAAFFELPIANPEVDGRDGSLRKLDDYADASIVVIVFMCNHCPFVVHVRDQLISIANEYRDLGVQVIGISSNDAARYPDDSFERMREDALKYRFPFPYLYDETQNVARSYGAVCTPEVFVFGPNRKLRYHGRVDETRPGMGPATGEDLRRALDQLIEVGEVRSDQLPSIGCSIKWKPIES